jgi:preprotein translocase subunit YajC
MAIVDKHDEPLALGDRVMVDGGLVGTVTKVDLVDGDLEVDVDGQEGTSYFAAKPTGWTVDEVESLGDGINQAMRAAQGQPN